MKFEAIYNQGKLEFSQPIHFRHDYFSVTVEVSEQEIVSIEPPVLSGYRLPPEVIAEAEKSRKRLDEIMNAPLPPDEELPPLSAKQLSRIEAFTLRENR